jgi:hypothetical protein
MCSPGFIKRKYQAIEHKFVLKKKYAESNGLQQA